MKHSPCLAEAAQRTQLARHWQTHLPDATLDDTVHLYTQVQYKAVLEGAIVEKPAKTQTICQKINNHRFSKNVYVYTNLLIFDFLGLKV
jgi:hypothetical protein